MKQIKENYDVLNRETTRQITTLPAQLEKFSFGYSNYINQLFFIIFGLDNETL